MFNVLPAIRNAAGAAPAAAAFFESEVTTPAPHLVAPKNASLGINQFFTGEAWFYAVSYPDSGRHAFCVRDSNVVNVGINWGFGVNFDGSEVYFTYTTSPTFGTTRHHDRAHGQGSTIGAWHHMAATRDHTTGTTRMFLNGVECTGSPIIQDVGSNPPIDGAGAGNFDCLIGVGGRTKSNVGDWHGYLAEIRVWDVVRTPAEILANYNLALVGNEPNLQMYLPLATDFNDDTVNGNNFSAVAGATTPAPILTPIARPF